MVDASPSVRMEARRCLGTYSERMTGEAVAGADDSGRLRAMLADPEPAVRARVVRQLAVLLDPAVPGLLVETLERERDPFVVCPLLQALAATEGAKAQKKLEPFLGHADPRVRATAVEALAASGARDLSVDLIPLLQDPHDRVRVAAARALHAQEREAVLASLDEMLSSRQELSQRSALYLLRYWEDEVSAPRLREALGRVVGEARRMALESISFRAQQGSQAAADLLAAAGEKGPAVPSAEPAESAPVEAPLEQRLQSAEVEVRIEAVLEAVRLGHAELLARLLVQLGVEKHPGVLATLVTAIGRLGSARDAAALLPYLGAEEPRVRANAVEAIGRLAAAEHADLLAAALEDPNNRARANAILALSRVPGRDVLPALEGMAGSGNPRFRMSAVYTAATLATPQSVAVLAGLLSSGDPSAAARARAALESLAPVMSEAAEAVKQPAPPAPARAAGGLPEETVQRLLFNLEHDSAEVRVSTLKAIAASPDPRLLAGVRVLLKDSDSAVRQAALEAMRRSIGELAPAAADAAELAELEETLRGDTEHALEALDDIASIAMRAGSRPVAELLARLVAAEQRPVIRASLLSALALVGDPGSIALARSCLRDPDPRVRANAIGAIELSGSESDYPAVVVCLADPDPRVRAAAIRVSVKLSRDEFLGHLRGMLASPTLAERAAALHVLRTAKFPKRLEMLETHFLTETDGRLLQASAAALAAEHAAGRQKEVLALLDKTSDQARRRFLLEALGMSEEPKQAPETPAGAPEPVPGSGTYASVIQLRDKGQLTPELIRQSLESSKDSLTIVTLLKAAAEQRLHDAFQLTQPFTYSRDRRVRLAATGVLGRIEEPAARACLRELAKDRDPEVSLRAVHSLRMMAPVSAFQAVVSLLEMGQPWAVRRGLELLDRIGDPAALASVLHLLERGETHPSYVEPVNSIVLAFGTAATLDELSAIYRRVDPNHRPFVQELGLALGRHLALEPAAVEAKFPPSAAIAEPPPPSGPPALPAPPAGGEGDRPPPGYVRLPRTALIGGAAIYTVVIGLAVYALVAPQEPPPLSREEMAASAVPQPPMKAISMAEFRSTTPTAQTTSTQAAQVAFAPMLQEALAGNTTPTVEEIEAQVKAELAKHGVQSPALLRVLVLERSDHAHEADVTRAEEAMRRQDFEGASRILSSALSNVDPEHLTARLQILRELEKATRLAGYPEQARQWHAWRVSAEKKILEMIVEAARQSGMPEQKTQQILKAFEERYAEREKGRKVLEVYSPNPGKEK